VENVVTIHPNRPRTDLGGEAVSFADVAGPDGGGEAKISVIGAVDQLVNFAELQHAEHRTKNLFAGDPHVVGYSGEQRRLDEIAAIAHAIATGDAARAVLLAVLDVLHDLVELSLVDLGALLGVGIERIANRVAGVVFGD